MFVLLFDGLGDQIGHIAKRLNCWSQINVISKYLFWMMRLAEMVHYFIDLAVTLSWTLSAAIFWDYFVLSLLSWFFIYTKLLFSESFV